LTRVAAAWLWVALALMRAALAAEHAPARSPDIAAPGARAAVRMGDHGAAGRVVFLLPPGAPAGVPHGAWAGDRFVLDLPGAGSVTAPEGGAARHVLGVQGGRDQAALVLEPGSTVRLWRDGRAVGVDVFAAAPPPPRRARGASAPGRTAARRAARDLARARLAEAGLGAVPLPAGPAAQGSLSGKVTSPRPDTALQGRPARGAAARQVPDRAGAAPPGTAPGAVPAAAARLAPLELQARQGRMALPAVPAVPAVPAGEAFQSGQTSRDGQTSQGDQGFQGGQTSPDETASQGVAPPGMPAPQGVQQAPLPAAPPLTQDEEAAEPAAAPAAPDSLRAMRLPGDGDAILLPFDPAVGAAAFPRGGLAHVVFDDAKPIDFAALKADPVFASARIQLLPAATHMTMALPHGAWLALHRRPEGWVVAVEHGPAAAASLADAAQVRLHGGVVTIGLPQAAETVVLEDAGTGGKLLVGTVKDHGPGVAVPHDSPEFTLAPSWEGVVLSAVSDRLTLIPVKEGFALRTQGQGLVTVMGDGAQRALESAGALTRRFDLRPLPVPVLLRRMETDVAAAALAPKQARFAPRLRAAQDMLALGLAREAAALLQAARQDDPTQAGRPEAEVLLAMAQFLADGAAPDDAGQALGAPDAQLDGALGHSDEVALWRALMPGPAPLAARAAVLAADWRLLTAYPAPLRKRLMPMAAALLVKGEQQGAARDVLAAMDGQEAVPTRAVLLHAQGKTADALRMLDAAAAGADRKQAAAAARAAIELRLQTGRITPAQAAAALQAHLFAWREPGFEIDGRLRAAALLTQAGAFREALAALQETDSLFGRTSAATHDRVHAAQQEVVRALIAAGGGAKMKPVDLVALVEENAALLGEHDVAASLTPVLVDKLVALDLPARAQALVGKLMDSTTEAAPRAELGATLAALRLDQGDGAGAADALDRSESDSLPPALQDRRAVLRAHVLAAAGQTEAALHALAPHASDDALEFQAQLLEKSRDWRGAETALQALAASRIPAAGALDPPQQDLLLRLASAEAQAGDAAALRQLQDRAGPRLPPGPRRTLFQMLAAQPVQSVADLPRSGREADAARAIPAALASYRAR
jgi:hypothetical protein